MTCAEWMIDPAVTSPQPRHRRRAAAPGAGSAARRSATRSRRQPATFLLRPSWPTPAITAPGRRARMRVAADAVRSVPRRRQRRPRLRDNATTGANSVRSFPVSSPGDEVLVTDLRRYGGVTNAAAFCHPPRRATLRSVEMPRPGADPSAFVDAIATAIRAAAPRIVLTDHISASTALDHAGGRDRPGLAMSAVCCCSWTAPTGPVRIDFDIPRSAPTGTSATCTSGRGRRAAPASSGRRRSSSRRCTRR